MAKMLIDGVVVTSDLEDMTEEEAGAYLKEARKKAMGDVTRLSIIGADEGMVDVRYICQKVKFERIRRITGYLVGTIDRWNNAKQAEEQDRVKHIGGRG